MFCILILLSSRAAPVRAATPTPTPTATPAPASQNAIIIPNSIPNQKIETQPNEEKIVHQSPTPIVEYHYTHQPLNPPTENFKIPTMDAIADWLMKSSSYVTAKQIKDTVKLHQPDNLFISGKTKRCVYIDGVLTKEEKGAYETSSVSYLPTLISGSGILSSQLARYSLSKTNDAYNLEGPAYKIDDADMDCATTGQGTTQLPPKTIPTTTSAAFNFLEWLKEKILKITIVYVSKQQTPEAERIHCTLTGCVTDNADIDLTYVKTNPNSPQDEEERLKKSGGIVDAGFRTVSMDTNKGKSPHGQEDNENFTQTNTLKTKQMENSADLIRCSLVPQAQRSQLGLTSDKCAGFVTELPQSSDCNNNTYFKDLYVDRPPSDTRGATGDPGYTIPYRSTACSLTESMIDPIARFAGQWGSGGAKAEENIRKNWQSVQDLSKKYGWNPLFVITLWIEESGAGATPNAGWHLGCLWGWKQDGSAVSMPKISEGGTVCDQMACLFSHPTQDPGKFARFMCSYNTTEISGGSCPSYPNWEFADQIFTVYQRLLNDTGNPAGCGFTEVHRP
jgi:hypothetical protein